MIFTDNTEDAFRGRTAHLEYDNAIEYAGYLAKTDDTADILPGMVVKNIGNRVVARYDGKGTPFGLSAIFVAPHFGKGGVNQLGPNREFTTIVGNTNTTVRVAVEALDPSSTFTFGTDGKAVPVYANADGKIASTGTEIIGTLLEINADKSIVIQLEAPKVSE